MKGRVCVALQDSVAGARTGAATGFSDEAATMLTAIVVFLGDIPWRISGVRKSRSCASAFVQGLVCTWE